MVRVSRSNKLCLHFDVLTFMSNWQQTEYVMGGGATNYMFLVLAADAAYRSQNMSD